jgi:hypothetical protein
MLKRNSWFLGILLGLTLPVIVFIFEEILKKDIRIFGKEDIFYLISTAINFFIMRYYFRADKEDTARGIALSTFSCALIFFYFKLRA